jgi:hypothetical protein
MKIKLRTERRLAECAASFYNEVNLLGNIPAGAVSCPASTRDNPLAPKVNLNGGVLNKSNLAGFQR